MRLLLLIAVVLLGVDALFYNGHYTQTTYREASVAVQDLASRLTDGPRERDRPSERTTEPRDQPSGERERVHLR